MSAVTTSYWEQVRSAGLAVPSDRPLDDLTAELTRMLGDPDPEPRDTVAHPTLAAWVARGVYDDLLSGLGDGMAAGLGVGLGERDTDSVFRRSSSALLLDCCLRRDNERPLVAATKVLEWGDRAMTWLVRERDVRGFVAGKGWAHTVTRGADLLATLAQSTHLAGPELTVILDVIAERLGAPVEAVLVHGEPDRLAAAAVAVLRRNVVALEVAEAWLEQLAAVAGRPPTSEDVDPYLAQGNAQSFLRALHLQLAVGPHPPAMRTDLLLGVLHALQSSNPHLLQPSPRPAGR